MGGIRTAECWQSLMSPITTTVSWLTACFRAAKVLSASASRSADEGVLEAILQFTAIYEL